ncbi:MAG: hypothetical protein ACPGPF_03840 [Pontibacterium sp.]
MYLAAVEQLLFWSGLIVFFVSLAMYAGRTKDFKSILVFWQPTIEFTKNEFIVNRVGLSMMILAVIIRLALYVIY